MLSPGGACACSVITVNFVTFYFRKYFLDKTYWLLLTRAKLRARSLAAAIYLVGEAMSVVDFWSERGDEMSLRAANVVKLDRK